MGVHLFRKWSRWYETDSCLLCILTYPLPAAIISISFFVSAPLKLLPHYDSNVGFSYVSESGRPPPACWYVVKIFPWVFATQCGSFSKKAPSTQILTFSTLAPSSSSPFPDTIPNPYTNTPQLPSIALLTGGYQFSHGIMNWKRHETHESCSSIRLLA